MDRQTLSAGAASASTPDVFRKFSKLNRGYQTRRLLREALGSAGAQAPLLGVAGHRLALHRLLLCGSPTNSLLTVEPQVDRDGPNGAAVVFNKNASLSLDHQRQRLPIAASEQAILHLVERHSTVIVIGHTGCGKTTQIPQVRAADPDLPPASLLISAERKSRSRETALSKTDVTILCLPPAP